MANSNFEKQQQALRKRDEKNYVELKKEIKTVQSKIERVLTMVFESSANLSRTNYSGLEMF